MRECPKIHRKRRTVSTGLSSSNRAKSCRHNNKCRNDECRHDEIQALTKAIIELERRQERLLEAFLGVPPSENLSDKSHPSSSSSTGSITPNPTTTNFFSYNPVLLQRYAHSTLRPEQDKLCDLFLARFNLPFLLSGSYDPIERIHMHGWASEDITDIALVIGAQSSNADAEDDYHKIFHHQHHHHHHLHQHHHLSSPSPESRQEVLWRHVDQLREPLQAQKLAQLVPLIKRRWAYQTAKVFDGDDVVLNRSSETSDFADPFILGCPGATHVVVHQSGYDSKGNHVAREPWFSGNKSLLGQMDGYDDGLAAGGDDDGCSWGKAVFGRTWQIFHDRRLVSFACIFLVMSQMSIPGDAGQRIMATQKALRFLSCHLAKWPRFTTATSEVWWGVGGGGGSSASASPSAGWGWLHMHCHLRVLAVFDSRHPRGHGNGSGDPVDPSDGLRPCRVSGKLVASSSLDDGTGTGGDVVEFVEQRFSVALVSSRGRDLPLFSVLYLSDSGYRRLFTEGDRRLDMDSPRGEMSGVAVYLQVLRLVLPLWEKRWISTLNQVDNLVEVKIEDLFDPKKESNMFDGTFQRSRLYFTILQTLRVFSEWIQESESAVKQLHLDFEEAGLGLANRHRRPQKAGSSDRTEADEEEPARHMSGSTAASIAQEWQDLLNYHSSLCRGLLDRIERKEDEIKGFRDGLLSATSVREASKATVMNQYILVFTFVTIFYLPLSYVSSLYGIDIFMGDNLKWAQASFYISTILIAVVTWVMSGLVLWLVSDESRLSKMREIWKQWMNRTTNPSSHLHDDM